MKKSILFLVTAFLMAFTFMPVKLKTGKIAFLNELVKPVFYEKKTLEQRLEKDICSILTMTHTYNGDKRELAVTDINYDTLEVRQLAGDYYLYASGKTNDKNIPLFQAYVKLTKKNNDLVIVSKNNPNSFVGNSAWMNFNPEKDENTPYDGGYWNTPGYSFGEGYHCEISTSAFESEGLNAYFK